MIENLFLLKNIQIKSSENIANNEVYHLIFVKPNIIIYSFMNTSRIYE